MLSTPFIFVTCQHGAEGALKAELAREHPDLRLAYSRPGFLTFKHVPSTETGAGIQLHSIFARTWGLSLGKADDETPATRASQVFALAADLDYQALHVWQRDLVGGGEQGFEPQQSPAVLEAVEALASMAETAALPASTARPLPINAPAGRGQIVLDCILVEPNQWWVGYHRAEPGTTRFPGGLNSIPPVENMVSRAYLKMEEALAWSGLPISPGDVCVEIGSAPGGASQALLARGLHVRGIDPAEMAPQVLAHPDFEHLKMRGGDLKRRAFADVDWLTADVNLAPAAMLRMVEQIVTHPAVHVRGLLLTLKLADWSAAERIPDHVARVQTWGYREVRVRQLAHNRREVCLAAFDPPPRRPRPKRQTLRQRRGK